MRDREADEQFIREALKQAGVNELVYITPNHYDGGYEVKVDTREVFVDYEMIDKKETHWV